MKFYEIEEAIRNCVNDDGEINLEAFEKLQNEKNDKIEKLALWTIEMKSDIEAIDNEIKRLQAKKTAIENKRKSVRDYLAVLLDGEKFRTPLVSVSCKTTERVVIDNEDNIPSEYWREKVTKSVDKEALHKAFEEWTCIQGCHIERNTTATAR